MNLPKSYEEAQSLVERIYTLPIGSLERELDELRASGQDPDLEEVYADALGRQVAGWSDSTKDLAAADVLKDGLSGVRRGQYSQRFLDEVVKPVWAERQTAKYSQSPLQDLKEVGSAIAKDPVGLVKGVATSLYEGGKSVAQAAIEATGVVGSDYEDQLKGGGKLAGQLETGARQSIGMLARAQQFLIPGDSAFEQGLVDFQRKILGDAVPRRTAIKKALESGDVDSAWKMAVEDATAYMESEQMEGSLAKAIGLNAKALEDEGIQVNDVDFEEIRKGAEAASELLEGAVPASLAFSLAGKAAKVGLKSTATGQRLLGTLSKAEKVSEKLMGKLPAPKTLAAKLETKADEVQRLAADAAKYNAGVKRARLAAGGALQSAGTYLQEAALSSARGTAPGLLAAAGSLTSGGDASDALLAGIAGTAASRILTSRASRVAAGGLLKKSGQVLASDLPLPLERFRKGLIDFQAQYRPVRAALGGAAVGTLSSTLWALGAETPDEAASTLVSGATFGAGGAVAQRGRMALGDLLVKQRAGQIVEVQGPVAPSQPLGRDSQADALHATAEADLTQGGVRLVQQMRQWLGDKADFYVAKDANDFTQIYNRFAKNPSEVVVDAQGVTISAENSVTGKPVAISRIGAKYGQSAGHEAGHALLQAAEANPETKWIADHVLKVAADALGAKYDPVTKTVVSSPTLDAIVAHYQSIAPAGNYTPLYGLHEYVAEHANMLMQGIPSGKVGGSRNVSLGLGRMISAIADGMLGTKAGLRSEGTTTSEALPYAPSFDLARSMEMSLLALAREGDATIPDASVEAEAGAPVDESILSRPAPAPAPAPEPKPRRVDVGVLNPVPVSLTTDRSLGTTTPPPQPTVESTATPTAPAAPVEQAPVGVTPAGAVRGTEVQAARTNFEAPLTEGEKAEVAKIQPNPEGRPAVERVLSFLKALGGQKVGVPIAEVTYRGTAEGDGKARSKRVAIYGRDGSTFLAFDIDRVNYNADLLFQWARENSKTLPYTGLDDPNFVRDVQTYVRNHAESRRGSGEPLFIEGRPSTASGEPVAKLTREQEQFISIAMGKAVATPRSAAVIGRQAATARASGVEPLPFGEGSIEPNALRDRLRREGAPIAQIGADPDPTRRQANPNDRNSALMRMAARGILDFKLTGQSTSIPNQLAFEASFMPAVSRASNEDVRGISKGYVAEQQIPYRPHDRAIPVKEDLAKRIADFYDKSVDSPNDPKVKAAYTALADEVVKQWKAFEARGYKADPWTGEGQPYANSAEMMADVRDNKHIFYFKTEGGFGLGGITPEMRSNPMLAESGVDFGDAKNVPVNDVFRVVHDIVGHGAHGYEFGPKGEFNAYLEHSRMFSDKAKPALAAETLAQNSWVNYGPHLRRPDGSLPKKGEQGFIPAAERRFADQKNSIIPKEILDEVDAYAEEQTSGIRYMPATLKDFERDNVQSILNKGGWAILTAENPNGTQGTPEENAARNAALEEDLKAQGLEYAKVKGSYGRPENSFIVLDPSLTIDKAAELARKYEQESVFTKHGLVYQDGAVNPARGIQVFDTAPEDFFTDYNGTYFSGTIDFDTKIAPDSPEGQSLRAEEALSRAVEKTSEGPQFMPAPPVESEAFKKWFDGSSATRRDGSPLRLFHGTGAEFKEFNTSYGGQNFGIPEPWIFLTNSREEAGFYAANAARRALGVPRVLELFAQAKKPFLIEEDSDGRGEMSLVEDRRGLKPEVVKALESADYDSVIARDTGSLTVDGEPFTVVILKKPEQVKSATSPTFDPENPARFMPAKADNEGLKKFTEEAHPLLKEADGTLKKFYHGSDKAGFMSFDLPQSGKTRGTGVFLTDDYRMASTYTKGNADVDTRRGEEILAEWKEQGDRALPDGVEIKPEWAVVRGKSLNIVESIAKNDFETLEEARAEFADMGYAGADLDGVREVNRLIDAEGYEDVYADDAALAEGLDRARTREPGIYELVVSAKDVVEIDWQGNNWDEGPKVWNILDENGDPVDSIYTEEEKDAYLEQNPDAQIEESRQYFSTDDAARSARDMGADAVLLRNVYDSGGYGRGGESGDVLVVFDPKNIKATNSLNFDKTKSDIRYMPLAKEGVKGSDVQFKTMAKKGSKGGIVDVVHFSSKNLTEIDPKKSFGKGAATATDMMGEPKVFFYVKGTSYEAPIAVRPNIYAAKIDGNALYDYNEDVLGVRSIVNREKRDAAIRKAGFVGYYAETDGFDAVALFEKTKVVPTLAEDVMNRRQLVDTGRATATAADRRRFAAEEKRLAREEEQAAASREDVEAEVRSSPAFQDAYRRLVESDRYVEGSFFFEEEMDNWVRGQVDAQMKRSGGRFMPASPAVVSRYLEQPEARGGFYVSSDLARPLIEGYDPTRPGEFQKAASEVADEVFEARLQDPAVDSVVFTAGGPGSGKTTATALLDLEESGVLTFDSVLGTEASAARDIQKALDAGKPVTVAFVYRPFEASVQGVIDRTARENRTVPVSRLASSHRNAMSTFLALAENFGGKVDFVVVDNSGSRQDARVVDNPVQFVQEKLNQTPDYETLKDIGERLGEASREKLGPLADTFLETRSRAGREDGGVDSPQQVAFLPEDNSEVVLPAGASFMPAAPGVNLEDFAGKKMFALTTDRMGIGKVKTGRGEGRRTLTEEAQGGRGFPLLFDGRGWAFSDQATASRFLTRVREVAGKDDAALVAMTALNPTNHLKSRFGQAALMQTLQNAVDSGGIKIRAADSFIREAASRASELRTKLTEKSKLKIRSVRSLEDFRSVVAAGGFSFAEMAALMRTLDFKEGSLLPFEKRKELGLDLSSLAKDLADPELFDLPSGAVVSIIEIPKDQTPEKEDLHYSYPWTVKGRLVGFLNTPANISALTTNPKVRNKEGRVTAQPLMTVMPELDVVERGDLQALSGAKVRRLKDDEPSS